MDSEIMDILDQNKIESDFREYMSTRSYPLQISALDIIENKPYPITLEEDDEMNIIKIRIVRSDKPISYFPYIVQVALGTTSYDLGTFFSTKGYADFLYNEEFELISIDFYYSGINDLNKPRRL